MTGDDRRGAVRLFLLVFVLTSAFVVVNLGTSRRNAVRQMEDFALAKIQLVREIVDGTLREAALILDRVVTGDLEEPNRDVRRQLLMAEQVASAAVYDSQGNRQYVLTQSGMKAAGTLPEEVVLRHARAGSEREHFVANDGNGYGTLWLTRQTASGNIVALSMSREHITLQLQLSLSHGMSGSLADTSGIVLAEWPQHSGRDHADVFLEQLNGVQRLMVTSVGPTVKAAAQLRGVPVIARTSIGPGVVLEQWRSQLPWIALYFVGGHVALAAYLVQTIRRRRHAWDAQRRELLVRETNHRVKNNLMIIDSILSLSTTGISDPDSLRLIGDTRGRIASVSLIHELLYTGDSLEEIPFDEYCERLVDHIRTTMASSDRNSGMVRITTEVESSQISAGVARKLGLIIHELVTNAVKHADPIDSDRVLRVTIAFYRKNSRWFLEVHDNGRIYADSEHEASHGIGSMIVRSLTEELEARLQRTHDRGTHIIIEGDVLHSRHGTDPMPMVR